MKLRLWTSIVLFISSYAPLSLVLLIQNFDLKTHALKNPRLACGILVVSILSVIVLLLSMRGMRGGAAVKVSRVSNQSGQLVNYAIPYMISFFGFQLDDPRALASFAIFMVLMCVLTIRTQNVFINPILAFVGYGLYDVEFTRGGKQWQAIFLSKQGIQREQQCQVRQLSPFLYCVTEADPKV